MDRERLRKGAQIALAVVAVLAGTAALWRFVDRSTAGLFGDRVVATPASGPIGTRPHLELHGFDGGVELTVHMCPAASTPLEECFEMGSGTTDERIRSAPIPSTFPDGSEVGLSSYVLRVAPEPSDEDDPVKGTFDVVPFRLGEIEDRLNYAGLAPDDIALGNPERIATGTTCRPPIFMPDGRITVGATVFDPATGTTIEMPLAAAELHWSPVGDKLAILTADRKEVRLAAADGSDPVTRVREARGLLSSLTWSPEGDLLAYIAGPDPDASGGPSAPTVQILNATTGEITEAGLGLSVAWSPGGDVLAVERIGPRIELSDVQGERTELVEGAAPAWSADGRFITFVRPDGEAWVALADGTSGAVAASGDVCATSFSPTHTTMALVTRSGENTELLLSSFSIPEA